MSGGHEVFRVLVLGALLAGGVPGPGVAADTPKRPCPSSPNCVSSYGAPGRRVLAPLRYEGTRDDALQRILDIIRPMFRTRIVIVDDGYVHVEFRSAVFRFVDDVEFFFDGESRLIHFRSASRAGYWDMGANRRRMLLIGRRFSRQDGKEEGGDG